MKQLLLVFQWILKQAPRSINAIYMDDDDYRFDASLINTPYGEVIVGEDPYGIYLRFEDDEYRNRFYVPEKFEEAVVARLN